MNAKELAKISAEGAKKAAERKKQADTRANEEYERAKNFAAERGRTTEYEDCMKHLKKVAAKGQRSTTFSVSTYSDEYPLGETALALRKKLTSRRYVVEQGFEKSGTSEMGDSYAPCTVYWRQIDLQISW